MHFLIVVSNYYEDISNILLESANSEIEKNNHTYQKISVPGALEISAVVSYAADSDIYDGFIALGCVIKGETIHYDIVCEESARSLNELAINLNLAVGNGILTVENKEQAMDREQEKKRGSHAANTAIHMAIIKNKFSEVADK